MSGRGYLDHVEEEVRAFLGTIRRILFFPFALQDHDSYVDKVRERFGRMGVSLSSAHGEKDPHAAVTEAEAIFIGGGNTFRLLKALQDLNLLDAIRTKVDAGTPYIGSSAGSNVAGPTIKTTNDMPIVQPLSFDALNLVPFQINPHFQDADPNSGH